MLKDLFVHIILSILLSFIAHLILHEVGHLLGGLITGWRFIYLQIFNIAVVKGKRLISFKVVTTSNFQCIMSPQNINSNPYIYTLGGCIANLFLTIFGFIALIKVRNNIIFFLYFWSLFVMGVGFLIMNGIPRVKQICNDMATYQLLKKDLLTRQCHNAQLMIANLLYKGCTYNQIGEELLCLPSEEAYNDILAYQAILEYYYYLDIGDGKKQINALNKIKDERMLSLSTKDYLRIERIYVSITSRIHKIIDRVNKKYEIEKYYEVEKLYGVKKLEEVEMLILKCLITGDVHLERVKSTVELYKELVKGNNLKAEKRLNQAMDYINKMSCLYLGEKKNCIKQLRLIKRRLIYINGFTYEE